MRYRRIAFALCIILGISGCSLPVTQHYDHSWERLDQRSHGVIDMPFKVPPTVEPQAESHVDDVSRVLSTHTRGNLVLLNNGQLARIEGGKVVWTSTKIDDFKQADFVQSRGRDWTVAYTPGEILIFDAYAHSDNQDVVRKIPVPPDSVFLHSAHEIYVASNGKLQRAYPESGYLAPVVLPEGGEVVGVIDGGIVTEKDGTTLVLQEGKQWKAQGSLSHISPSHIVTSEGNTAHLYDLNGAKVADVEGVRFEEGGIAYASNGAYLAFSNALVNVTNGQSALFPSPVLAIHDKIAYTKDGGFNLDGSALWENTPTPLVSVRDGRAIFFDDSCLYFSNFHTSFRGQQS